MSWHSHVVVGYDGSRTGDQVVRWAVAEAKLRRIGLTICHVWRWEFSMPQAGPEWQEIVKRMAGHVLEHGAFIARAIAPNLRVRKILLPGPVHSALLHEAGDAEAIVVGVADGELNAGSAVVRTAAMAACPVVVVRGGGPANGRVVVGVDGTRGSDAALAFGFEEAALKGWCVHAVHGHGDPVHLPKADPEIARRRAGAMLERAVAPWRDKYPQVVTLTHLVMEPAREALTKAAAGAEMLVVGDHGEGGRPPLMLGEVSLAMLRRAPCTVTVAHPWRPSGGAPHHESARRAASGPEAGGPAPVQRVSLTRDLRQGAPGRRRWRP